MPEPSWFKTVPLEAILLREEAIMKEPRIIRIDRAKGGAPSGALPAPASIAEPGAAAISQGVESTPRSGSKRTSFAQAPYWKRLRAKKDLRTLTENLSGYDFTEDPPRTESPNALLHRWARPGFSEIELDRFLALLIVPLRSRCWTLRSIDDLFRYSTLILPTRTVAAHIWVFDLVHGPVPSGFFVDHICENKRCANPDHLQLVAPGDNVKLSIRRREERARRGGIFGRITSP